MLCQMVVCQHVCNFLLCESKAGSTTLVCEAKYLQVIQPCEDALFTDAQAAGEHSKLQMFIGFQGIAKQIIAVLST